MIFIIKSSSKPYWSFFNNIKLIKNIYISKNKFILKFDVFYSVNSCIFFQIYFLRISF